MTKVVQAEEGVVDNMTVEGSEESETGCNSFAAGLIWFFSVLLIVLTFPLSLCICIRMVQVIIIICIKICSLKHLIIFRHRNTREPSSSGSAGSRREAPLAPGSSSSFLAWIRYLDNSLLVILLDDCNEIFVLFRSSLRICVLSRSTSPRRRF